MDRTQSTDQDSTNRGNTKYQNDVSWYSRNPALLHAVASIPFPYRPGMVVPWATSQYGLNSCSIPGILSIRWMPTVGHSETATDPASIVGKEIFAKVREKFSGSIDIDAPDFVIYLMCLDSMFAYIAHLKRIYRILTAYTSENHYIPDALLQALGFSNDQIVDMKEHRMQLFQVINELVYMTRKFNIPAVFDIINRHYWLNDNVYMDDNTINSQFYVFACDTYYKYVLGTWNEVKVGNAQYTTLNVPNTKVVEYLFEFGRGLIDSLAGSDDAYIISGYLMRAYEGTPVFSVDELRLDEVLVPVYEPEVLMQIENAQPILYPVDMISSTGLVISGSVGQNPDTNAVVCVPKVVGTLESDPISTYRLSLENFLSIRSDMPTVADVTLATRLKMGIANYEYVPGSKTLTYDVVCGSEIVRDMNLWMYTELNMPSTPTANGRSLTKYPIYGFNLITSADAVNYARIASFIQSFDWHPILSLMYANGTAGGATSYIQPIVVGDVHNLTLLTNEMLKQLNRVCLYSEFNAYGQI